ncbi:hypothetical protein FB451DRAFT_1398963 [Mycena latifolia]|nr:hypothetical protein FB451DRAFT_1398963 [Mycena latifolia]
MKTNTDTQSSSSLPAYAAAISTDGMTRPSDDSQSTAEDYSINVEGPECSDAAPGSSLDGALGHNVFARDFSQYNLPNPSAQPIIRAHSFGDDRRASACMFRRRAYSASDPFSTTTSVANADSPPAFDPSRPNEYPVGFQELSVSHRDIVAPPLPVAAKPLPFTQFTELEVKWIRYLLCQVGVAIPESAAQSVPKLFIPGTRPFPLSRRIPRPIRTLAEQLI